MSKLIRDHHLLTRNLKLNGKYISNDGGDEGITIDNSGNTTLSAIAEIGSDTDKFLMSDSGVVKYVTGANLRLYIGAGTGDGDITGVSITTDSGGGSKAEDTAGSADFSILGSSGVDVTNSGATITAVAVPSEIDHDSLNNFVANEHIDHTSVTLTAGDGLTGGGDISSNISFAVSVDDSTIEINSDSLRVKDDGITYAKIQNMTDARILGNNAGSDGVITEMTKANVLSFLNVADGATAVSNYVTNDADDTMTGNLTITKSSGPQLTLGYDANEKFTIDVEDNGVTTLATTDNAGTSIANLTLDIDGTITFDSNDGRFKAKNAGTEFSVSNSAFAGMISGYTTVGIDTFAGSYTLTTTMTTVHDDLKVTFVAPPSGVIEISVSIYGDMARRGIQFGLSDQDTGDTYQAISFPNATDVTNEHYVATPPSSFGDRDINHSWVVTGLTSGTTYVWYLGAKSIFTGGVLRWGGNVANKYGPFIMKATALPTPITHYAVYG